MPPAKRRPREAPRGDPSLDGASGDLEGSGGTSGAGVCEEGAEEAEARRGGIVGVVAGEGVDHWGCAASHAARFAVPPMGGTVIRTTTPEG